VLKKVIIAAAIALFLFGGPLTGNALAQTVTADDLKKVADAAAAAQSAGDTAFMLVSSALVLLMTPGLAFFYGGFVRSRNVLNTLMMSFVLMGIVGVTWILWGYSLAFAPGNALIGGIQWVFGNVGLDVSGYLPHMAYEGALKAANPKYADLTSYAGTIPHRHS
jgi:ammonium transporter, Amt family